MENFSTQVAHVAKNKDEGRFNNSVTSCVLCDKGPGVAKHKTDKQCAQGNNQKRNDSIDNVNSDYIFLADINITFEHLEENLEKEQSMNHDDICAIFFYCNQ